MNETLTTLFQHSDKGLSFILVVYFVVKIQPAITKLIETVKDLKESSDRREEQAEQTQKEIIKLLERLKYQNVGAGKFTNKTEWNF